MTEDNLVRALGDLQGTVRSMAEQWRRQEDAANAGRRGLYERFELLSDQVLRMTHSVEEVTRDVAELRNDIKTEVMPTIDAYRLEVARRLGVMWAGRTLWTILIGVAGAIGFAVHELIQFLLRKS